MVRRNRPPPGRTEIHRQTRIARLRKDPAAGSGLRGSGGQVGGLPWGVQQRAVLAMLTLHLNQVISTDVLVDGLWAEHRTPLRPMDKVSEVPEVLRLPTHGQRSRPA